MKKDQKGKVWQIVASFGAILAGAILAFAVARIQNKTSSKMIVATSFPAYDFARAVAGEENVEMLVPPGTDLHHYEPTPADLKKIEKAKLLVYGGGESEEWVLELLNDFKGETFKMLDAISQPIEETETESEKDHEHAQAFDEHVWTSPKNALAIIEKLRQRISAIDPINQAKYEQNATKYSEELKKLDTEISELVAGGKRKLLAFGDRFPFAYFVRDYGLEAISALSACAEEAEPDSKTMSQLIERIKSEKLPIVLKLEQSESSIAETIAKETGASVRTLDSFHVVSKEDLKEKKTYLDLWQKNLETLRAALYDER